MTRQQAIEALQVSLTVNLERWVERMDGACPDSYAWATLGYYGDDVFRLMAKAAVAVLEGIVDSQEYLQREGMLKD